MLRRSQLNYTAPQTAQSAPIYDYFSLSSQRMILPPEVETAARRALADHGGQSVFTYLANLLERASTTTATDAGHQIPYSTITAIDLSSEFPLRSVDGTRHRHARTGRDRLDRLGSPRLGRFRG